jgi:hypothetical protein
MLRPIGSLPPTVYWRRRLLLLAPLVLVAITIYVALNAGGSSKNVAGPAKSSAAGAATSAPSRTAALAPVSSSVSAPPAAVVPATTPAVTPPVTTPVPTKPAVTPAASPVAPGTVTACVPAALSVAGATGAPSYPVGATPTLYLQVTNIGATPCVENLSDSQVELLVYNGASRVWGSHDCALASPTPPVTLPVKQPVRLSVLWTGLSSQPACAGTRVRVNAGIYTLHVLLGGVAGTNVNFTLTAG